MNHYAGHTPGVILGNLPVPQRILCVLSHCRRRSLDEDLTLAWCILLGCVVASTGYNTRIGALHCCFLYCLRCVVRHRAVCPACIHCTTRYICLISPTCACIQPCPNVCTQGPVLHPDHRGGACNVDAMYGVMLTQQYHTAMLNVG